MRPSGSPGRYGDPLTRLERDVLRLMGRGHAYRRIANELGLSPYAVTSCVERIYGKLAADSNAKALKRALELGLLNDP